MRSLDEPIDKSGDLIGWAMQVGMLHTHAKRTDGIGELAVLFRVHGRVVLRARLDGQYVKVFVLQRSPR
ncbi:MAG: hypothetical protein ACQESR_20520 [Planctomycetota bacterium]